MNKKAGGRRWHVKFVEKTHKQEPSLGRQKQRMQRARAPAAKVAPPLSRMPVGFPILLATTKKKKIPNSNVLHSINETWCAELNRSTLQQICLPKKPMRR